MCTNLWTELINTRGLRKTSNKEKVKRRLSLRREGILGRIDLILFDLRKITLDSQDLPTPRWLVLCSKNRCIEFSRRSRTSHSLNGRKRWLETLQDETRASIANTIKTRGTLRRNARIYRTTWNS